MPIPLPYPIHYNSFFNERRVGFYFSPSNCLDNGVHLTRGVNIFHIGKQRFSSFLIPIPPLAEQHEIVRRVEILFAFADRLQARYQAARSQVEQLTPALLAQAFRGELVPQDPNDEPAAALLERIQTQPVSERASEQEKSPKPTRLLDRLRDGAAQMGGSISRNPEQIADRQQRSKNQKFMLTRTEIKPTHLTSILLERGPLTAEALWTASQLEIDDFYEQLKSEEIRGLLKEIRNELENLPRSLEAL